MKLNEKQKEAIRTKKGPLLVLAGAGSGKTTVLIKRVVEMLNEGIEPKNILAIAFTNKASNEIKERISKEVNESVSEKLWISTFHRLCIEILKTESFSVPFLNENFKIATTFETRQILKNILEDLNLNQSQNKLYKVTEISSIISLLKNEMVTDKMLIEKNLKEEFLNVEKVKEIILNDIGKENYVNFVKVYSLYQQKLRNKELLDLDDILFYATYLMLKEPMILDKYQERFKYISVDEYQDTNRVQYVFLKKIAEKYKNICVVGDPSQSIYRFRGAEISSILNFKEDFPEGKIIKLEKNYRSTKIILKAANQIISHNKKDIKKELFTEKEEGEKITLYRADFNTDEAEYVAKQIKEKISNGTKLSDIAVFYRNNSDSASLERVFKNENIPYKLSSEGSFFEQLEILDIIKYLEFIQDQTNVGAFSKIINQPKRGIGKTTIDKIIELSQEKNILEICQNPEQINRVNKKTIEGLKEFHKLITQLIEKSKKSKVSDMIANVVNKTNYTELFKDLEESLIRRKKRNIKKLVSEAREMEQRQEVSLDSFLKSVVRKDIDAELREEGEWNEVNLTTIHSAKGLEFPIVYLIGLKEQGFPSQYALTEKDIEEERRLCHVAFTRAKEELHLSYPKKRIEKLEDKTTIEKENTPSRFIFEFDQNLLKNI